MCPILGCVMFFLFSYVLAYSMPFQLVSLKLLSFYLVFVYLVSFWECVFVLFNIQGGEFELFGFSCESLVFWQKRANYSFALFKKAIRANRSHSSFNKSDKSGSLLSPFKKEQFAFFKAKLKSLMIQVKFSVFRLLKRANRYFIKSESHCHSF